MASTATRQAKRTPGRRARRAASGNFGMLILLIAEYVLGIAYNLYGTAPTESSKIGAFSNPLIALHATVGTLLILVAIYLAVAAARARILPALAVSVIGLLSLLAAWACGSAFSQTGANGYSMAMAVLTAVALLCYLINMRILGRHADD
jgi:hypothetical protein